MKELITRIEELAVQLEAANRQIEISATDARDALGQLNRANKKLVEMHDDGNRLRDELDPIRAAAKHYGRFDGNAVMIITQAANDEAIRQSNGKMVSQLRAEVETLKHERDSAINECERLRAESKETIGDLRAQVDARLIERLSRQQAPLQVLYKELLSMREALGSKLRASVDKTTEALRGVAANETAQTKMHEGEVPKQEGSAEEP